MSNARPQLEIRSREQWRAWLDQHHRASPGIWLVTFKKSDPDRHVPYEDVVQEALAFGWVDSQPRKLDHARSQLLVTPRKPGSNWSRANKRRVASLVKAGLMAPAGLAAVEAAKADGSWTALDDVENLIEPDDLRAGLDERRKAREEWDAFPRSTRRAILEWIGNAKKPETRAKRIRETVDQAARGVRANQWRQPTKR